MSVAFSISLSLFILWKYGPKDFAINMTVFWVFFGIMELVNLFLTRKTISQKFHEWAITQPTIDVWFLVSSVVLVVALLMIHLAT